MVKGNRYYSSGIGKIEKTHKESALALTQVHNTMEGRPIVRETSLAKYLGRASFGE